MNNFSRIKSGIFLFNFFKHVKAFEIHIPVFDLISGLSAYVILGPKNRPN